MAPSNEALRSSMFSTRSSRDDRLEALYDVLLPRLAELDSQTVNALLLAGNRTLHRYAERTAYRSIQVEVAVPGYTTSPSASALTQRRKLDSIFSDPSFGRHVRSLTFRHAVTAQTPVISDKEAKEGQRRDSWDLAVGIIELCPGVQELRWETGLGISPSLWKVISQLENLRKLVLVSPPVHPGPPQDASGPPRITPQPQLLLPPRLDMPHAKTSPRPEAGEEGDEKPKAVGQGGWGLGKAWNDLEVLELANLSQAGAKTLTAHLKMLSDHPTDMMTLRLSTNFFDLSLLTAISRVGSWATLRHLEFATNGTKLTAEGLKEVVEGCRALESLTLNDVEGRLDKNTWRNIDDWPATLRSIVILIGESSNHHSWVLHHLNSIHHLPVDQLSRLWIRRLVHPMAELPYPPSDVVVPAIQGGHAAEPIPVDLLEAILEEGGSLEDLCLDWWMLELSQMEALLKAVPLIRRLRIAVQSAVSKITSMVSAFSQIPYLEELEITSPPEHNVTTGPFKPCCTSEELSALPPVLAVKLESGDQSLPDIRDLRKFARKLPRLRAIAWIGRNGRGTWHFNKKSSTALLVNVNFVHLAISVMDVWHACRSEAPSFDFEDTPIGTILEVPPLPVSATQTDFPALTRTTTGNSSRTTIQTPVPSSPVATTQLLRRFSLPTGSNPSKEVRAPRSSPNASVTRGYNSAPARNRRPSKVPLSPQSPRMPQTPISHHLGPNQSEVKTADKLKPKKSYAGILENLTRHVPGSGRATAGVEKTKIVPKKEPIDQVTIVEDDEDAFERYSEYEDNDLSWTTVVKEKPKDKVKIPQHLPLQSAKAKRKDRKAKK